MPVGKFSGMIACPLCGQNSKGFRSEESGKGTVVCIPQEKADGSLTKGCGDVEISWKVGLRGFSTCESCSGPASVYDHPTGDPDLRALECLRCAPQKEA